MSEEDLNTYKKYVSDLDIIKYIVLDSESNHWYSAEYVDEMLKKQDKEILRLNNIINELVKFMDEDYEYYEKYGSAAQGHAMGQISRIKNKLQELKGSDKNEKQKSN